MSANPHKGWGRLVARGSATRTRLFAESAKLYQQARRLESQGKQAQANTLYDKAARIAEKVVAADRRGATAGPIGKLPNPKRASKARNGHFFSAATVAAAKQVKPIRRPGQRRVIERDMREGGEIIGVQPGGFVKVKWDNRERPTLIKRSEIKRYPYLRNPAKDWERLDPRWLTWLRKLTIAELAAELQKHRNGDLEADAIRAIITEKDRARRARNPGIMEIAGGLQALDYLGGKMGVRGRRKRNPLTVPEEEIAVYRNGKRRNNPSVTEMSKRFQGRATGKAQEYYFSDAAPRLDMSRGGRLIFLKLKRTTIRVPASVVAIDPKLERLWLGTKRAAGMFKLPERLNKGETVSYGDVDEICYLTAKAHIGNGKPFEYHHTFGEDGGRKPTLLVDHEGMPILKGGDYKIEDRGIVN